MTVPPIIRRYGIFDLVVASSEIIPSLESVRIEDAARHDVLVSRGAVARPPTTSAALEIEVGRIDDTVVLEVDEVGRFALNDGRTIVIAPHPEVSDDQVHAYLLGSVFGTLLHQRGVLPIHCNAIDSGDGASLFCGDSGAGKSTLAAFMQQRGHRLLTDDLCPLNITSGGSVTAPAGIPRLKLGAKSRDLLGLEDRASRPVPWSSDKVELDNSEPVAGIVPVVRLYHLREAEAGRPAGIHRLHGIDVGNVITANIYRRRIADLIGAAPAYMGRWRS